MTNREDLDITQLTGPGEAYPAVRQELTACWVAVTNPAARRDSRFPRLTWSGPAGSQCPCGRLNPSQSRILLARVGGALAGWVALSRDPSPLIAHWGVVSHLQTQLVRRNAGIGSALMLNSRKLPATRWAWRQLHLAVRGGMGLEGFYGRLGWQVTGRWPGKLRFAPSDTRDEILMILTPL